MKRLSFGNYEILVSDYTNSDLTLVASPEKTDPKNLKAATHFLNIILLLTLLTSEVFGNPVYRMGEGENIRKGDDKNNKVERIVKLQGFMTA